MSMMKKRGLGKGLSDLGLSALLGDLKTPETLIADPIIISPAASSTPDGDGQFKKLPMTALKPGKYQPRKIMAPDALEELANSIRQQGVIQPIVVRPIDNHCYEIIAGERRWRAAQLAELQYIPAIVREINDEAAMLMALIENIQRRDLNVIEEASALNRLMTEFSMTHNQVADAVGKSRTNVTNILRLLKLNFDVRKLVEDEKLDMGHARALLVLEDEKQNSVANMIVTRGLSVRETEEFIRKLSVENNDADSFRSEKSIMHSMQSRFAQKLGMEVSVSRNAKGHGKLVVHFKNEHELESLLNRMS